MCLLAFGLNEVACSRSLLEVLETEMFEYFHEQIKAGLGVIQGARKNLQNLRYRKIRISQCYCLLRWPRACAVRPDKAIQVMFQSRPKSLHTRQSLLKHETATYPSCELIASQMALQKIHAVAQDTFQE